MEANTGEKGIFHHRNLAAPDLVALCEVLMASMNLKNLSHAGKFSIARTLCATLPRARAKTLGQPEHSDVWHGAHSTKELTTAWDGRQQGLLAFWHPVEKPRGGVFVVVVELNSRHAFGAYRQQLLAAHGNDKRLLNRLSRLALGKLVHNEGE